MVGLTAIFWTFVFVFGLIGLFRGWAKELLVTFSVILAMFIISVLERFAPFVESAISSRSAESGIFWLRSLLLMVMIFFGYQTPSLPKLAGSGKLVRERLQDSLLGLFLGGINGYLIIGSIWFYMNEANYPFGGLIAAPDPNTAIGQSALNLIKLLPPTWMAPPAIYFAVAIAFVFVLVVFV